MTLGQKVMAVACAMGLTVGAGMASRAMAQDGQIRTVAELNKAISAENLDRSVSRNPLVKRIDGDGDGIYETVAKLYLTSDGGRIAVYSHQGVPWLIGVDSNRTGGFDYGRLNEDCNDTFEKEIDPAQNQKTPRCTYQK